MIDKINGVVIDDNAVDINKLDAIGPCNTSNCLAII